MSINRVEPTRTAAARTVLSPRSTIVDVVGGEAVEGGARGGDGIGRAGGAVQRARQAERALALLRREADVAGREREAVVVAHGRHDADLERDVEVADEPADHRDLLRVLLAEVRALGPDDVEELEADGRDAAEVPGPRFALRAGLLRLDPGREAVGIELGCVRREDDVDAVLLRDREVARLVARVRGEVGRVVELRRIDEERHHDALVLAARGGEQRAVAGVERAHRRHEAGARRGLELGDRADDLHASATVASASAS